MNEYSIKSEGFKKYSVQAANNKIGYLDYKSWLSLKADIILLTNGKTFTIEPEGLWGTTIVVKKGETILLSYKMKLRGIIIIRTTFDNIEQEFVFKQRGVLHSVYVLLDKEGQKLLTVHPAFKWKTLSYHYTISTTDIFDELSFAEVLLFTAFHCTRYFNYIVAAAA